MGMDKKRKVILAFDGGVEVAVAGCLLKVQGYDVMAVHVRIWEQDEEHTEYPDVPYNCAGIKNETHLRKICKTIQIPFDIITASDKFKDKIIEKYVHSKVNGIAFDACRDCINTIVIKSLIERLEYFGADAVATGHHARITYNKFEDRYSVWRSKNSKFDASWMLYDLSQDELAKLKFPTGDLYSEEIEILAEKFELNDIVRPFKAKKKPCFLESSSDIKFIEQRTSDKLREFMKGEILDQEMKHLKEHDGIYRFVKGKKPSCKVSGKKNKFVTGINAGNNSIIVGPKEKLYCEKILLNDVNLISIPKIKLREEFYAQIGGNPPERCMIESALDKKIIVEFFKPEYGFFEGEDVVLYDNNLLLGGGIVEVVLR